MDKKFTIRWSMLAVLGLWVLVNLYDGIITWLFSMKHDISQYESNLLYLSGVVWPILILIKLAAVAYIVYIFTQMYHRWWSWVRFGMVHLLIVLVLMVLSICVSNTKAYAAPVDMIQPIPVEQRKAAFIDRSLNLKGVSAVGPSQLGIPYLAYYFIFNIGIFLLWQDFEKGINIEGGKQDEHNRPSRT